MEVTKQEYIDRAKAKLDRIERCCIYNNEFPDEFYTERIRSYERDIYLILNKLEDIK